MSLYTYYGNNISRYLSAINFLIKIYKESNTLKEEEVYKSDFLDKKLIFFDQYKKLKIQNNIRILFDKLKDNDIDLSEFKNWFAEIKIEEIDLTPVSEQFESDLLKLKRNIEICQINSVTESYLDTAKSYSSDEVRKIIIANLDSSLQEYLRLRNEEWDNLTSNEIFSSIWNSVFYFCKALTFHIASFFKEDLYFGIRDRRLYWDNIFYFIIHKAGKEFGVYLNNWYVVTELYKLRFKVIKEKSYEPSKKELQEYYDKIACTTNELTDLWLRMTPYTDILSEEDRIENLVTCPITDNNLKKIINKKENQYIEFKEELNIAEKFAKEMIGFANSNNGVILVGVNDDGDVKGIKDSSSIQAKILNIASNNCIPAITPKISVVKCENVDIVVVQVKKDNKVISDNNKKIWIRKGNITINPDTREIEDLFNSCKSQS